VFRKARYALNLISALDNFRDRRPVCSSRPALVWLEPTNACNLKCPMCLTSHRESPIGRGFMDMDLFRKVAEEISAFALDCYLFLAGESLLHPQITEMVRFLKSRKLLVLMDSNGCLLTPELSRSLVDAGLDFLSFSFDGYEAATYEKIRVNASFDQTVNNIKSLLEYRKKKNRSRPFVRIRCIQDGDAEKFSAEKKEAFMKNFEGLPVDEFAVAAAGNWNNALPDISEYRIDKSPAVDPQDPRYHPCAQLWTAMTVRWNGSVGTCCMDLLGENIVGNASEKTLLEIWNDAPLVGLRERHIRGDIRDIPVCSGCSFLTSPLRLGLVPGGFSGPGSLLRSALGLGSYRAFKKWSGE
jgi:MoaA/NifB/PqqE/SkfB family radical SAM enzyme